MIFVIRFSPVVISILKISELTKVTSILSFKYKQQNDDSSRVSVMVSPFVNGDFLHENIIVVNNTINNIADE